MLPMLSSLSSPCSPAARRGHKNRRVRNASRTALCKHADDALRFFRSATPHKQPFSYVGISHSPHIYPSWPLAQDTVAIPRFSRNRSEVLVISDFEVFRTREGRATLTPQHNTRQTEEARATRTQECVCALRQDRCRSAVFTLILPFSLSLSLVLSLVLFFQTFFFLSFVPLFCTMQFSNGGVSYVSLRGYVVSGSLKRREAAVNILGSHNRKG